MIDTSLFKKIVFTLIAGLSVTAVGVVLTWLQVTKSELQMSENAAREAVTVTERMLEETKRAAELARPLLLRPCTSETKAELSRLSIVIEPIRIINFFRQNKLSCSSYTAAVPEKEKITARAGQSLILTTDDYISPGVPVMIFKSSYPEGDITVSVATHWSARMLNRLSQNRPLTLRAVDVVLTRDNHLEKSRSPVNVSSVHSGLFPFSVEYPVTATIPLMTIFRKGALSLFLSVLLGIAVATSIWLVKFRKKSLHEELSHAVRLGEIVPWYQPIVSTTTGKISGVEVLARWIKPDGKVITPDEFIFEAEKTGLIVDITRYMMLQAARELPALFSQSEECWHIGFNFTQSHFMDSGFIAECQAFVDSFSDGNVLLTIELTEREPFDGSHEMLERLRSLHTCGFTLALDDFGTGYANMEYLHQVSVDIIKIDRIFVNRIGQGKSSEKLLLGFIDMAATLDLKIIAEGVETEKQAVWLKEHGVEWLQGYLYSPPVPPEKLQLIISNSIKQGVDKTP
ncbi:EAL domain-containing protein [Salmonella enterica]